MRPWAARVLFVWLFALATGMANACWVAADRAADHGHGHHAVAHVDDDAPHQGSFAQANCQDFCDKAALALPALKTVLDDGSSVAILATAATAALRAPPLAPAQVWLPHPVGVQAPPIPIAFLRLAL